MSLTTSRRGGLRRPLKGLLLATCVGLAAVLALAFAADPAASSISRAVHVARDTARNALVGSVYPDHPSSQQADAGDTEAKAVGLDLLRLDSKLRQRFEIPKNVEGVVVASVSIDSPMAIRPGDAIESINLQSVTSPEKVAAELVASAPGDQLVLLINRHGTDRFIVIRTDPDEQR
jgi:S1-C subfamily serine protease